MKQKIPQYFIFLGVFSWALSGSPSTCCEDGHAQDSLVIKGSVVLPQIITALQNEGYSRDSLLDPAVVEQALNTHLSTWVGVYCYHGSPNKGIDVLDPQSKTSRNVQEGPVIFASPYPEVASCFLFEHDDSWTNLSVGYSHEQNVITYTVSMVIGDRVRFAECDRGGSLYYLPTEKFVFNHAIGLGLSECIRKESVKPLRKVDFTSALAAMQVYGVNVIFLEPVQFVHYKSLPGGQKEVYLEGIRKK